MANPREDAPLGAKWTNSLIEEVVEQLDELCDLLITAFLADGYLAGTKPLTLKGLKTMPPAQVIYMLEQMIADPSEQREGTKLLADYLGWMTKTFGRLAPQQQEVMA